MQFLLEDSWNIDGEAEDIILYAKNNNIECKILDYQTLYDLDSKYFLSCVYFCNTDIVQHHLSAFPDKLKFIPDTYDSIFEKYYNRKIETLEFKEFLEKYNNIK